MANPHTNSDFNFFFNFNTGTTDLSGKNVILSPVPTLTNRGLESATSVSTFNQTPVNQGFMIAFVINLNTANPDTEFLRFTRNNITYRFVHSGTSRFLVIIRNETTGIDVYTFSFPNSVWSAISDIDINPVGNLWKRVVLHFSHTMLGTSVLRIQIRYSQDDGTANFNVTSTPDFSTSVNPLIVQTDTASTQCSSSIYRFDGTLGAFIYYVSAYSVTANTKGNPPTLAAYLKTFFPDKSLGTFVRNAVTPTSISITSQLNSYGIIPADFITFKLKDASGVDISGLNIANMQWSSFVAGTLVTINFLAASIQANNSYILVITHVPATGSAASSYDLNFTYTNSIINISRATNRNIVFGSGNTANRVMSGTDTITFSISPSVSGLTTSSTTWNNINGYTVNLGGPNPLTIGSQYNVSVLYNGNVIGTSGSFTVSRAIGTFSVTSATTTSITIGSILNSSMNDGDTINITFLRNNRPLLSVLTLSWESIKNGYTVNLSNFGEYLIADASYTVRLDGPNSVTRTSPTFTVARAIGTFSVTRATTTVIPIDSILNSSMNDADTINITFLRNGTSVVTGLSPTTISWLNLTTRSYIQLTTGSLIIDEAYTLRLSGPNSVTSTSPSFTVERFTPIIRVSSATATSITIRSMLNGAMLDSDPVSFTISPTVSGLSISTNTWGNIKNGATLSISGTPLSVSTNYTLRLIGYGSVTSTSGSFTVPRVIGAVSITSATATSITIGSIPNSSMIDSDTISFSISPAVSGLSISTNTWGNIKNGITLPISGTPLSVSTNYTLTLTGPSSVTGTSGSFTVPRVIGAVSITNATATSITIGSIPNSLMIDSDPVSFSISPAVSGLSISTNTWGNIKNGITLPISGTPLSVSTNYTLTLTGPSSVTGTSGSFTVPRVIGAVSITNATATSITIGSIPNSLMIDSDTISFSISPAVSGLIISTNTWGNIKNGATLSISGTPLSATIYTLTLTGPSSVTRTSPQFTVTRRVNINSVTSATLNSITISFSQGSVMNDSDSVSFIITPAVSGRSIPANTWGSIKNGATLSISGTPLNAGQNYILTVDLPGSIQQSFPPFSVSRALGTFSVIGSTLSSITISPISSSIMNDSDSILFYIEPSVPGLAISLTTWGSIKNGGVLSVTGATIPYDIPYDLVLSSTGVTRISTNKLIINSKINDISTGCSDFRSVINPPMGVDLCSLQSAAAGTYIKRQGSSFSLNYYYEWSDTKEYLFKLLFKPGVARNQRYIAYYPFYASSITSTPFTVNFDGSGNIVSIDIPISGTTVSYNVIPDRLLVTRSPSSPKFLSELFTPESYNYNNYVSIRNYTLLPTAIPYKKELAIFGSNGTRIVRRPTIAFSQSITHGKLLNSTNGKSDVFIHFENFSDDTNFFVYICGENGFDINNALSMINRTTSFDNGIYNTLYIGWSVAPVSPPLNINYTRFKNLTSPQQYYLFYCFDNGAASPGGFLKYTTDTTVTSKTLDYGSYVYENNTIKLSTGTNLTYIDGLFYASSSTDVFILMSWISNADEDINLLSIPLNRQCAFGSFTQPVLPSLVFNRYVYINLPILNLFPESDGIYRLIKTINVNYNASTKLHYINFYNGSLQLGKLSDIDFALTKPTSVSLIRFSNDNQKLFRIIGSNLYTYTCQYVYQNCVVRPETINFTISGSSATFDMGNMVRTLTINPGFTLSDGVYMSNTITNKIYVIIIRGGLLTYGFIDNSTRKFYNLLASLYNKDENNLILNTPLTIQLTIRLTNNNTISYNGIDPSDTGGNFNVKTSLSLITAQDPISIATNYIYPYLGLSHPIDNSGSFFTIPSSKNTHNLILSSTMRAIGSYFYETDDRLIVYIPFSESAPGFLLFNYLTYEVLLSFTHFRRVNSVKLYFVPNKYKTSAGNITFNTNTNKANPNDQYSVIIGGGDSFIGSDNSFFSKYIKTPNGVFYIVSRRSQNLAHGYFINSNFDLVTTPETLATPITNYSYGDYVYISISSNPTISNPTSRSSITTGAVSTASTPNNVIIQINANQYVDMWSSRGDTPIAFWNSWFLDDWTVQTTIVGNIADVASMIYGIVILDAITPGNPIYSCGIGQWNSGGKTTTAGGFGVSGHNVVINKSGLTKNISSFSTSITIRLVKKSNRLFFFYIDNTQMYMHSEHEIISPSPPIIRIGLFARGQAPPSTNFEVTFSEIIFI